MYELKTFNMQDFLEALQLTVWEVLLTAHHRLLLFKEQKHYPVFFYYTEMVFKMVKTNEAKHNENTLKHCMIN